MTAVALVGMTSKRPGLTSFQVLSKSRIGQIYADVLNNQGHLRGKVREPQLSFPLLKGEQLSGRRSVQAAVYPGDLSVVRSSANGEYGQSSVHLVSGEIDADVEHFLTTSDQIPTFVATDILLDESGRVAAAGGILVQALPDGDRAVLEQLRALKETLPAILAHHTQADAVLSTCAPTARPGAPLPLRWQCRCSAERVKNSLRLFPITDLVEMLSEAQPIQIHCDFCAQSYQISQNELRAIFEELIKAQA